MSSKIKCSEGLLSIILNLFFHPDTCTFSTWCLLIANPENGSFAMHSTYLLFIQTFKSSEREACAEIRLGEEQSVPTVICRGEKVKRKTEKISHQSS